MKIAYTINPNSKNVKFIKDDNNVVFAKWNDEIGENSSLGFNKANVDKILDNPTRLISEGNNIYINLDNNNNLSKPIFKMVETYPTKMGGMEFIKYNIPNLIAQIYIPFKDSSEDEYVIRLNIKEEDVTKLLELVPDAIKVANTEEAFKEFYYANSPRLEVINTSKSGEWTKIKVQLTLSGSDLSKSNIRVFAKSSSGYIANREVYTDENGTAEFKVLPYGLEQGEIMKAEFGFKYVSNVVSADVQA